MSTTETGHTTGGPKAQEPRNKWLKTVMIIDALYVLIMCQRNIYILRVKWPTHVTSTRRVALCNKTLKFVLKCRRLF